VGKKIKKAPSDAFFVRSEGLASDKKSYFL